MCTMSLPCPLCCQSIFPNIDALRLSLLKVTSRPIKCPICVDELMGLDKLTIHLFGHSILGKEGDGGVIPPLVVKKPATSALKYVRKVKKEPPVTVAAPAIISDQGQNVSLQQPIQTVVQLSHPANSVKCDVCGDEFRDHAMLRMHRSVFHEFTNAVNGGGNPAGAITLDHNGIKTEKVENRFSCNACSKTFKMKGSLKIHMRVVHPGCPPRRNSSSSICTSSGGTPTTTITSTTATTPVYTSDDVIHSSLVRTSPPTSQLIVQPLQPSLPQSPNSLLGSPQQQTSFTISATTPFSQQPQIIEIIAPRQLTEFIYVANTQQQQSHQQVAVDRAIANNTPPSVPSPNAGGGGGGGSCSSVPSPAQAASPLNSSDSNKQWECDVCLKSFTTKYFLKKHKRLHTGEMPYSCQICGKAFTFQQSYHKHLLYHSDEKPHVCTVCGRAFKELSTLHNHERIHSGEKPFSCETCGKCFRQRVSYLVHRRIHTNTQPYKCTACGKSFRYKVSQRTHKCPAQPPGTVVRQPGDLLTKLLQTSAILPTLHETSLSSQQTNSEQQQLAHHNHNQNQQQQDLQDIKCEDYLDRTLDELLNESYDKMGIGDHPISYDESPHGSMQTMHQNSYGVNTSNSSSSGGGSGSSSSNSSNSATLGTSGEASIVPRIGNLCLMSTPSPQQHDVLTFDGDSMEVIDSIKLDLLYN